MLTGKGLEFSGSLIRNEATGYGTVYFLRNMLERAGDSVAGEGDYVDYVRGANIAGFVKVADAMLAFGVV